MNGANVPDKDSFEKHYKASGSVSSIEDWAKKHGLNVKVAVQEHREIKDPIVSEIKRKGGQSILDLGCGYGFLMSKLNEEYPDGGITGIDISRSVLENAKSNMVRGGLIVCCAEYTPFVTDAFDCVVCSEVIEHVASPKTTLLEVERILKTDGYAIISTDNASSIFRKMMKLVSRVLRKKTTPKTEYIPLTVLTELIPENVKIYKTSFHCPYPLLPNMGFLGSSLLGKIWLLSSAVLEKPPHLKRQFCNKYIIFGVKRRTRFR